VYASGFLVFPGTHALSAAAAADFCLGIICRQCDSTTKVLGKILSSPFLLLPVQLNKENLKNNIIIQNAVLYNRLHPSIHQIEKYWPN